MKSNTNYKLLFITDNETGRDVEMLLPLRFFAERILQCTVKHAFVYDLFSIYREKPDILVLPNIIGSHFYFNAAQYAREQGIPVFALTSEGNFRTDGSFDYWGYNTDKCFFQEFVCLWSSRTVKFLQDELPEISSKIVLTGGSGFDRYKIYEFANREDYLKRKGITKKYTKVLGYAGWAFGKLSNKQGLDELLFYFKNDITKFKWLEEQRVQIVEILKYVIEKNPDILFILKKHPNENNPSILKEGLNEMNPLMDYENVLYVTEEESVHESLSISDFWMAFESTTAIEGWMMGKESVFLNPDPNFNRDPNYKGSVLVKTGEELQRTIDEFYLNGKIGDFYSPNKVEARNQIITDTIGFSDGMNHIRAGYFLNKTLEGINEKKKNLNYFINYKYLVMSILIHFGCFFL